MLSKSYFIQTYIKSVLIDLCFQVSQKLKQHSAEPFKLPPASEQVIADLAKNNSEEFSYKTPPSSPGGSSLGSRKSSMGATSMCSISSAGSNSSLAHPNQQVKFFRVSLFQFQE